MKRNTFITIIILLCSNFITASQNKIFLEKRGFYDEKSNASVTIFPTINKDNTMLTVSGFSMESNMTGMKMSFFGILLNLTNGRVERTLDGIQAYFIENDLFINDMTEMNGKWMGFKKVDKIFSKAPYYILDLKTNERKQLNFPPGEYLTDVRLNYIATMKTMEEKSSVFEIKNNILTKKGVFDLYMANISADGKEVYGTSLKTNEIKIYDLENAYLKKSIKLNNNPIQVTVTKDNKIIYSEMKFSGESQNTTIYIRDRINDRIYSVLSQESEGTRHFRVNETGNEMITVNKKSGLIKFWSIPSGEQLAEFQGCYIDKTKSRKKEASAYNLDPEGKFYIVTYSNGIMNLFSSKERKVVADMFVDGTDWAVIARDGRADGTEGAFKKLEWQEYDSNNNLVKKTSLDATFSNFYTPRLLYSILNDGSQINEESQTDNTLVEQLNNTPKIKIEKPVDNFTSKNKEISLKVTAKYFDDPIKEILVYLNGKLIDPEEIDSDRNETEYSKTYNLYLLPGENKIKCKAVSFNYYESEPDEITVQYGGKIKKTSDLYMLVIGINKYKNPKYELNYALADALAFKEIIEKGSQSIFNNTEVVYLSDANADKESIQNAFNTIKSKAEANDVFIFYYAGHGVMSEEQKSEFFIVPYDVTQLYGNNDMLRSKGISAKELQTFSKELYAQKQLFIFDACQSGGMVELLASRGVAEERAIAQLARSTGTFWLTASNSEQYATEFEELGHGLFTYTILEGLEGGADGSSKDKKITVKEISAYINDMVPQLSKKYKGSAQFPNSYGYGQDFPVKLVK